MFVCFIFNLEAGAPLHIHNSQRPPYISGMGSCARCPYGHITVVVSGHSERILVFCFRTMELVPFFNFVAYNLIFSLYILFSWLSILGLFSFALWSYSWGSMLQSLSLAELFSMKFVYFHLNLPDRNSKFFILFLFICFILKNMWPWLI